MGARTSARGRSVTAADCRRFLTSVSGRVRVNGGPAVAGVTIGIDIGTTSVKAVAADGDGNVVAQARVPHAVLSPEPDLLEHDAAAAWYHGPREALAALGDSATSADAVAIAAMGPQCSAGVDCCVPVTEGCED